jgi:nucleotide-binding universal stress UspA family protein
MSLIVVGVDGSEPSRRALTWALRHGARTGLAVQAIAAVETKNLDELARQQRLVDAERELARTVERANEACTTPPVLTYEVVEGDPTVVLVDASQHAELIVLGAHPMTSIRNPELSRVSVACIRMGACPVLVVPAGAAERAPCADLAVA